jgi:hypothetical protein
MGKIGEDARTGWEENPDEVPSDSQIFEKKLAAQRKDSLAPAADPWENDEYNIYTD